MNVMAKAHQTVRNYIETARKIGQKIEHLSYRDLLKGALRVAHRKYKEQCEKLATAFRNLFRIVSPEGQVVANITAHNRNAALATYLTKGGKVDCCEAEQISHGYPKEILVIYA